MTLTEVSYYSRKFAPFAVLGIVFFLIFYGILALIFTKVTRPPTTTTKTASPASVLDPVFGKISKIVTSSKIDYPPDASFILDTIEGKPVSATSSAKVFFLPPRAARFGYLQTSYLMAKTLGFDTTIIKHQLQATKALFEDSEKKAVIDITNFNFDYTYKYENIPELFTNSILPTDNIITENAKQFLRAVNKYPDELARGNQEIIYMHFDPSINDFTVVNSAESANAVEVDFYRPDIDGLSVRPPRYFNSQNYVVMIYNNDNYKVIKSQIKFFEKNDTNYGVYPLKTGEEAYNELIKGKGLIVSSGQSTNSITVNKMLLVYFDPDIQQQYLQPVYVFVGASGFAVYVPAVKNEYVE